MGLHLIFHPVLKYIEDLVAVKVERSTFPEGKNLWEVKCRPTGCNESARGETILANDYGKIKEGIR